MSHPRRATLAVIPLLLIAQHAFAQVDEEFPSNPLQSKYFVYFLMATLAIFLLLIITVIVKRTRGVRKADLIIGMSVEDVGSLKEKGLLTEEESRAVRQALARQVAKKLQMNAPVRTHDLMLDPEVLRLQDEAAARKRAENAAVLPATESPGTAAVPPAPALPGNAGVSPAPEPAPEPDIELPPDIVTMVELGLITPEELANIKARAREKRRTLNNT